MKKAMNIIGKVLTVLLIVFAVFMTVFTVILVNIFTHEDRSIFGYKAYIVLTDSMSSVNGDKSKGYFDAGDLIFVKKVDPSGLKAGDIIAYRSTNPENLGEVVTHKIRRLTTDKSGAPGFITYGTAKNKDDANVVTYFDVVGKYKSTVPKLGTFFSFLKTGMGYTLCVFLPLVLLILLQVISTVKLYKRYKAEGKAELEAQNAKEKEELERERRLLKEERLRQEEMMEKLLELQKKLEEKKQFK